LITSQLSDDLKARYPHATRVASRQHAVASVVQAATPGDIILTLGAGDVNQLIDDILYGLQQRNP